MKSRRIRRILTGSYIVALVFFTVYAALDTFVIPHRMAAAQETAAAAGVTQAGTSVRVSPHGSGVIQADSGGVTQRTAAAQTVDSGTAGAQAHLAIEGEVVGTWDDGETSIVITKIREYDTDIYIADVLLSSASALRTALANDTYGRNVKEETSAIAAEHDAVLAVNGDFYGSRTEGYVIRNGTLYRENGSDEREDLVIYGDGSFEVFREGEVTASALVAQGAEQVFSFGPALLEDGEITVTENEEVGKAKASNPRTAIGIAGDLHYVLVVSDGRTTQSEGLSLYALATVMKEAGVTDAYNLDGGGSSTMVFQGEVINNPTTGGRKTGERSVSDIIYIGR